MNVLWRRGPYTILKLFYERRNKALHVRGIARETSRNESTTLQVLQELATAGILSSEREANLKKFSVSIRTIPELFPLFDREAFQALPLLQRNAITEYLARAKQQPLVALLFGSTAKGSATEESDLDLLLIVNNHFDDRKARESVTAQTGLCVNALQVTLTAFKEELRLQRDPVIQSALNTGYPVHNERYYHELTASERSSTPTTTPQPSPRKGTTKRT